MINQPRILTYDYPHIKSAKKRNAKIRGLCSQRIGRSTNQKEIRHLQIGSYCHGGGIALRQPGYKRGGARQHWRVHPRSHP